MPYIIAGLVVWAICAGSMHFMLKREPAKLPLKVHIGMVLFSPVLYAAYLYLACGLAAAVITIKSTNSDDTSCPSS